MATTSQGFDLGARAAPVDGGGPFSVGLDQRGLGAVGGRTSLSLTEAALRLTRDGLSWGALGQPTTVTWGMRTTSGTMPEGTSGFTAFGPSQSIQLYFILQAWADVANVVFQSTPGDTGSILFGNYSSGAEGAGAFAFLPGSRDAASSAGDVWVNSSISYNQTPSSTNYGWFTLLHEIGHALGLSHPGDYDASANGVLTYTNNAGYYEDSNQYTVMSYFDGAATGMSAGTAIPMTPMLDDIAAIQRLYGANMSTRTGDDIYGWNNNQSMPWFNVSGRPIPVYAVWDAGGIDTFNFSVSGGAQTIDLRQGSFSDVSGGRGNVSIAYGTIIENAVGAVGNDTIYGNSANNRITGNGGQDFVDGGLGDDTLVLRGVRSAYTITEQAYGFVISGTFPATPGGSETIQFRNIEFLVFSDTFVLAPTLSATAARSIQGDATNDVIIGAAGADILSGGEGDDRVEGLAGADALTGGRGADQLIGGEGADRVDGGLGNDVLDGGTGDDILMPGVGSDVVRGGEGVDTLSYSGTSIGIVVDLAAGQARGPGSTTLSGVENVTGSLVSDRIRGDAGANYLDGSYGFDILWGGGGDDLLRGGAAVTGGAPDLIKSSYAFNTSVATAISLDPFFSAGIREGVQPGGTHATVQATATGGLEYYAFTVTEAQTINLDIDDATFDTTLRVFNAAGVELASNDDGTYAGDGGSSTDSHLAFRAPAAGVYYVQVGRWATAPSGFATVNTVAGGNYTLHVTGVTHPTVSTYGVGPYQFGEDGNDNLFATAEGAAWLDGGAGDDLITITTNGTAVGGSGNDRFSGNLFMGWNTTIVYSGAYSDYEVVFGTIQNGFTRISSSLEGSDTVGGIQWARFADRMVRLDTPFILRTGTDGADVIVGNSGGQSIIGGGGADTITGASGSTYFTYQSASDSTATAYDTLLNFEVTRDAIDLRLLNATSISLVRSGASTFVFAETPGGAFQLLALNTALTGDDIYHDGGFGVFMTGTTGRDDLIGSYRADSIVGGEGSDIIVGGRGRDALSGGAGVDIFRYRWADESNAAGGIDNLYDFETGVDVIDLTAIMATSISIIRSDNGSSFVFAETPLGGFLTTAAGRAINGGDFHYAGGFGIYMVGSSNSDILTGTSLADPIAGGAGDDIIIGGGGADALFGDAGADLFVYRSVLDSLEGAADGIFGFVSGQDRIDLSGLRNSAADVFGIAYLGTGSFLFVDIGGDGYNELVIQLANTTLVASDINWGSAPSSAAPAAGPTGGVGLTVLDEAATDFAEWSSLIGQTGGAMADLETVWAHGRHGPDWYL